MVGVKLNDVKLKMLGNPTKGPMKGLMKGPMKGLMKGPMKGPIEV